MTYFLLLAGVVLTAPICHKKLKLHKKSKDGTLIYIMLWTFILVSICGLRRIDVGRDTSMYSWTYKMMSTYGSWKSAISGYTYLEFGYYGMQYLVSRIFDYQVFLFICAIISIVPIMVVVYRYSENKMMSIILFITFPYYTFCMSGLRQACALGVIMLAYIAVREKRLLFFLLLMVLACSFHTSALLFLPIYWIDKIPYKKIIIFISVALMIGANIFKSALWSIATLLARQQYTENDAGGQMMYLFMILTVILGFYYRYKFTGENQDNKVLLYMQVIATIIWPIASVNSALFRMYYYYHIFFILYVPTLIVSIRKYMEKGIVTLGYYAIALYFITTQVLPEMYKFNPYHFFWQ